MPLAAVITIIGAALTILVLAAYLISIVVVLQRVDAKLRAVTADLQLVPQKTEPVGAIISEINDDLAGVDGTLRGVLAR